MATDVNTFIIQKGPEKFFCLFKWRHRLQYFYIFFFLFRDEAGIAPLLDVEDMVQMKKPDWKCVFTYVQAIYLRFKDED